MSENILKLETLTKPTLPVDEDLVSGLEILLQKAKNGDMQGMAYVMVQTTGLGQYSSVGTGWRGKLGGQHILLGALKTLEYRILLDECEF